MGKGDGGLGRMASGDGALSRRDGLWRAPPAGVEIVRVSRSTSRGFGAECGVEFQRFVGYIERPLPALKAEFEMEGGGDKKMIALEPPRNSMPSDHWGARDSQRPKVRDRCQEPSRQRDSLVLAGAFKGPPPAAEMLLVLLLSPLWGGYLEENPEYVLQVAESVTVQKGLCVFVPCTFYYPRDGWNHSDPLYIFWFLKGADIYSDLPVATNKPGQKLHERAQGRFLLLGDPQANNCSLSIGDAREKDGTSYFFRLERGSVVRFSFKYKTLSLNVIALTQTPDIQVPAILESGRPGKLTCSMPASCQWRRSLIISWKWGTFFSLSLHDSEVTIIPQPKDHGAKISCQVTFLRSGVTTKTTVQLNVSSPAALENGSTLSVPVGQSLRLVCVTDSNPPAKLSWTKEGKALNLSGSSEPGVLELPRLGVEDGGRLLCLAQHALGLHHVAINLSVQSNVLQPLVLLLLKGIFIGLAFALTYGLTWTYYTR
ncbi:sialic acid-binding Ig-like lectin 14 [Rhynchocyon petersi]